MQWRRAILISLILLTTGCSLHGELQPTLTTTSPTTGLENPSPCQQEIRKFYQWLRSSGQLVTNPRWYPKTKPKTRRLDPETLEPLPEPVPIDPPVDEIIKKAKDTLKGLETEPC